MLVRQDECLGQRGDGHPAGSVVRDRRRLEGVERAERTRGAIAAIRGDKPRAGVESPDLVKSKSETRKPARPRGSSLNRVATSVVRSNDSSCRTTGTLSRVNCTSSSHAAAPAFQARRAASSVFSGARKESPRCATIAGSAPRALRRARKRFFESPMGASPRSTIGLTRTGHTRSSYQTSADRIESLACTDRFFVHAIGIEHDVESELTSRSNHGQTARALDNHPVADRFCTADPLGSARKPHPGLVLLEGGAALPARRPRSHIPSR